MTRKKKLKILDDVELRYSRLDGSADIGYYAMVALLGCRGWFCLQNSAGAAERVQEVAHDCPGAPFAWVSDTYSDLHKNIIPSLIDGLSMLGWELDRHYVINKEPPRSGRNGCTT